MVFRCGSARRMAELRFHGREKPCISSRRPRAGFGVGRDRAKSCSCERRVAGRGHGDESSIASSRSVSASCAPETLWFRILLPEEPPEEHVQSSGLTSPAGAPVVRSRTSGTGIIDDCASSIPSHHLHAVEDNLALLDFRVEVGDEPTSCAVPVAPGIWGIALLCASGFFISRRTG